ncbi:MAG: hypothetical protein V1701_11615 [Planctomycetota bacterium]
MEKKDELLEQALECIEKGDFTNALEAYDDALKIAPVIRRTVRMPLLVPKAFGTGLPRYVIFLCTIRGLADVFRVYP